jgi:DnaK suppressor protein
MLTQEQQAHLEELLRKRTEELRADMRREAQGQDDFLEIATEFRDPGDSSFATLSVDVSNAEVARDLVEMRAIEAALVRMDEGSYGECMQCGTDIPYARLEVQPTAERCIPCQGQYEKTHSDHMRGGTM